VNKNNYAFPAITVVIGLSAIVLQFYFALNYWTNQGMTVPGAVGQYFSYYTILTNILACISIFAFLDKKKSLIGSIFLRKEVIFGINVNLIFVGIAFTVLLRNLWTPGGLQLVVNEILHSVLPVLYLIFYILHRTDYKLSWKHVLYWQLYPVGYALVILMRGKITGLYPYPFIDVNVLGLSMVLLNIIFLLLSVFILTVVFFYVDRVIEEYHCRI